MVLAPKVLPKLGRRLRPSFDAVLRRTATGAQPSGQGNVEAPAAPLPQLRIGQAIAKTITFRIIVTALDFTTNDVVIGELQTAAGLSAFNLVAGPLFYLAHETAWNYLGKDGTIEVKVLPSDAQRGLAGWGNFTISRALAKTITFRTIASVVDFTVNYGGARRGHGAGPVGLRLRGRSLRGRSARRVRPRRASCRLPA